LTDNPEIKESTSKRYKGLFEKHILPKWKNRKLKEIRDTDIIDTIDAAKKRGRAAANSTHTILSAFFGWCVNRKRLAESPMRGMKKPLSDSQRDRVLSDEEITIFWKGCDKLGSVFGRVYQLLLATGCRRNEIGDMKWSEVDLKNRVFTLPSERSKNGRAHRIYLSDPALTILKAMPRIDGCAYVFTTDGENASSGFSKSKAKLDEDIELKDYTLHDLRRTMASGLAALGFSQTVTEKVLNHASGTLSGVAGIYNRHSYESEMKRAWEAWGNKIAALVADQPSNVVAIGANRARAGRALAKSLMARSRIAAMQTGGGRKIP
jgi:integrase